MKAEARGIRFSILDLGKMQCDQNLVVSGSLYATRSCPNKPNRMLDTPIDSLLIDVPGYYASIKKPDYRRKVHSLYYPFRVRDHCSPYSLRCTCNLWC